MSAKDILELLKIRHRMDLLVPECKNGPTHTANHLRLDAWVMKSSWVSPLTTGYEIKVSRSDFLNDTKWVNYLDYCNEFYFVCPSGLIQPSEVGEGAGLLWMAKTGTRLYNKKKAPYREVEVPEFLYKYILMCRASIFDEILEFKPKSRHQVWLELMESREINQAYGRTLGKRIGNLIDENIYRVVEENQSLKDKYESYEKIREYIIEVGLDPDNPSSWSFRRKLNNSEQLSRSIDYTIEKLEDIKKEVDVFQKKEDED